MTSRSTRYGGCHVVTCHLAILCLLLQLTSCAARTTLVLHARDLESYERYRGEPVKLQLTDDSSRNGYLVGIDSVSVTFSSSKALDKPKLLPLDKVASIEFIHDDRAATTAALLALAAIIIGSAIGISESASID